MTAPEWLDPLAAALVGLTSGGGIVAWFNRDKTEAEGDLAHAEASKQRAEAESVAVRTIKEALVEVKELSAGKDAQIAQVRGEMHEQAQRNTDAILAMQTKHSEEMVGLHVSITELTRQQASMASALSAHGQWDMYVLAHVRQTMPDFPDPPPLSLLGGGDG